MKAQSYTSVGTNNLLAVPPAKQPSDRLRSAIASSATFAVGVLLFWGLPVSAQDNPKPIVSRTQAFAVSAPVRDLAKLPAQPEYGFRMPEPVRQIQRSPAGPVVDVVEQSTAGPASNFSIGLNFLGIGNGFPGYTVSDVRPDTNIGVGDTQIVQWAASSYAVFDKATGTALTGAISRSTLFQGLGGICSTNNSVYNIAQWDRVAHRWLLAGNTDAFPYTTCVAVSTSPDAMGTYFLFQFRQGSSNPRFPNWGVWTDGYYKTQEEFNGNGTFLGDGLCAYNRAKMLAGDSSAEEICFQLSAADGGLAPADVDSNVPPPAGQDELFATLWDASHMSVYSLHPDFANPANSFVTGNNGSQLISLPAFNPACNGKYHDACVPQKDVPELLEVRGGGFLHIAYWDDNPLTSVKATPPKPLPTQHWYMVNDVTASGGNEAPRWYEFTAPQKKVPVTGLALFQSGTFAPDSNHRWMSSIVRDKKYNILLGYNISSSDMYPSIAVTGRTLQDPLGTMEGEVIVVNGGGSQTQSPGSWGGMSAMRIDLDGCTFFHTNEYYLSTALRNWSTQIVSSKFAGCN